MSEGVLQAPELGPWRAGNTGTEGVWVFDSGRPGRHVMVSALIHGNEWCGAWAVLSLLQGGIRPGRGRLTLALCNLDAFDRHDAGRPEASRFVDEDLNRQWSPERLLAADSSERRRARALRPFVESADWLLDLHSMHEPCAPLLLTGLHPRNLALARALRSPARVVVDGGHADGVRLRDFGRFGRPDAAAGDAHSLLAECGLHADPASRDVARDLCARFLVVAGTLAHAEAARLLPGWRQADAAPQEVLEVTSAVVARSERFRFIAAYRGLETIARAGTVIGDNDGEPVATPYDDCVLVMPSARQARHGVTVVRFARRRADPQAAAT